MPHGTISIERLVKITVITGIGFAVGFAGMSFANGIGYMLSASVGGHPTGSGNIESQLIAAGVCALIAAAIAVGRTADSDEDVNRLRVQTRFVFIGLLAVVLMSFATWLWSYTSANAAEREKFLNQMTSSDLRRAFEGADGLARLPGGENALRDILLDPQKPTDVRLLAGMELAQWLVTPPAEVVSQVDAMIAPPGPIRRRFVAVYSGAGFFMSPPFERWMLMLLKDPDPSLKFGALGPLLSTSAPPLPQLCGTLKQLASDGNPSVRAESMFHTRACPDDQLTLLKAGARDADATVREATIKRIGWRLIVSTEDTIYDVADRLSVADMLVDDPVPTVRDAAIKQRDYLRAIRIQPQR